MTVEVATYVGDLVSTNPAAGDPKSEGDDHLRLIKATLQATLPNLVGRFGRTQSKATNYDLVANDNSSVIVVTAGGVTIGSAVAAGTLGSGFFVWVFATNGDVTFNPNGAETVNGASTAVIYSSSAALLVCDGTNWRMFVASPGVFLDSLFRLKDETTGYELSLQLSGLTANRVLTAQDAAGSLALTSEFAYIGLAGTSGRLLLPQGYYNGFDVSRASATTFSVSSGVQASSDGAVNIIGSSMTKSLSAWAAGNGNGGKLAAAAVANTTWYPVFALWKTSDGTVDYGFDTATNCPNIPSGYSKYALIGWFVTDGSAQIVDFYQSRNEFWFKAPTQDINNTWAGVNNATYALRVPNISGQAYNGSRVKAIFSIHMDQGVSNAGYVEVVPADWTATAPSGSGDGFAMMGITHTSAGATRAGAFMRVWTDASGQIKTTGSSISMNIKIVNRGFEWNRG